MYFVLTFKIEVQLTIVHYVKLLKANTRMKTKIISLYPASGRCAALSADQSELIRPLEIVTVPFPWAELELSLLYYYYADFVNGVFLYVYMSNTVTTIWHGL